MRGNIEKRSRSADDVDLRMNLKLKILHFFILMSLLEKKVHVHINLIVKLPYYKLYSAALTWS